MPEDETIDVRDLDHLKEVADEYDDADIEIHLYGDHTVLQNMGDGPRLRWAGHKPRAAQLLGEYLDGDDIGWRFG